MREAQVLQGAIDRVVRYRERILLVEPHDQIARPPANHTVDSRDRTLLYDPSEKGPVRIVELGRHPGEGILMRPSGPCALNRITQSRSVWRSIPPIFAAFSREAPSSTPAIANSLRACAASFARFANWRTSPTV